MKKTLSISSVEAQGLAVKAFAFLAADSARIGRFFAMTGIDPANLRELAESAVFLSGVMEHVLQDETLLLTFCAEAHIDPTQIAIAQRALVSSSHAGEPAGGD